MTEGSNNSTEVIVGELHFDVTNIVGETISYVKKLCASNALSISESVNVFVFSMSPNNAQNETILEKQEAILTRSFNGKLQIMQGVKMKVTDKYVISLNDIFIQFS